MLKPANRMTLHDNILAQLTANIRSGQWRPGDKLPGEVALAQQFQVSRNCIREVLKALALANVVESRPGHGTFLAENALRNLEGPQLASSVIGDTSLWELKEIRCLLEGHAAYLAAQRATDEQIHQLELALNNVSADENITESHANFHKILAETANNRLLVRLLESVQREMDLQRERFGKLPKGILDTYTEEHSEIFKMVKEHRPEDARKAMLKHIDDSWTDSLYEDMRE